MITRWRLRAWIAPLILVAAPALGQGTGAFHIADGQIYDPSGRVFIAAGINLNSDQTYIASRGPAGQPLTTLFPGINMVRVATGSYVPAASFDQVVAQLTALHIVVEIEHHPWPIPKAYQGRELDNESAWYASVGRRFKDNPYVWFGTMNEPQGGDIAAAQRATYDAIRGTGNNNPILLEQLGGGNPGSMGPRGYAAISSSAYTQMRNTVLDIHFYQWGVDHILGHYSSDQNQITSVLLGSDTGTDGIRAAQHWYKSADGVMPVIIGEYGPGDGQTARYPIDFALPIAVGKSGYGYLAWAWSPDVTNTVLNLVDPTLALTKPWGKLVAELIANTQRERDMAKQAPSR
jgi:Cellulase (glycosyl hydrolase family 5)